MIPATEKHGINANPPLLPPRHQAHLHPLAPALQAHPLPREAAQEVQAEHHIHTVIPARQDILKHQHLVVPDINNKQPEKNVPAAQRPELATDVAKRAAVWETAVAIAVMIWVFAVRDLILNVKVSIRLFPAVHQPRPEIVPEEPGICATVVAMAEVGSPVAATSKKHQRAVDFTTALFNQQTNLQRTNSLLQLFNIITA